MKKNISISALVIAFLLLALSFGCKKEVPKDLPTLTTTTVSNITSTSATSGGTVSNDGGAAVTARGVCWSTSQSPLTANFKTTDGSGIGSFTSTITGLSVGTYYVRAYATNSVGTAYGNQVILTIYAPTVLATLTTTVASAITASTATSGGNITNTGGAFVAITARGVCWSVNQNPTIADNKTSDGTGGGSFISSLTGLKSFTTYNIRAYATNSVGTAYGTQVSFTTPHAIGETFQGGVIAYIFQTGDVGYIAGQTHGLIAAASDLPEAFWCREEKSIPEAQNTYIGSGNLNTTEIRAHCSETDIAARLCIDLISGGYNDWYLPSKDELNKLYISKALIGGFGASSYWSSSEDASWATHAAFSQSFTTGSSGRSDKYSQHGVRPIRTF